MLEYSKRQEIRQRLWDQLDKARVEHLEASANFDLLVRAVPSRLPHPDGSLRIQQAARQANAALLQYMQALKQFTDFTLNGNIQEDLVPPEQP